jgi:hypothetical protein
MRVAVIYRQRNPVPPERAQELLQGVIQWSDRYGDRIESGGYFAAGGGLAVTNLDDSAELHRMLMEHPYTPFCDVECLPLVDRETALATLQDVFAARTTTD